MHGSYHEPFLLRGTPLGRGVPGLGLLAQPVEHRPVTAEVAGSSPVQTARQPLIGVANI